MQRSWTTQIFTCLVLCNTHPQTPKCIFTNSHSHTRILLVVYTPSNEETPYLVWSSFPTIHPPPPPKKKDVYQTLCLWATWLHLSIQCVPEKTLKQRDAATKFRVYDCSHTFIIKYDHYAFEWYIVEIPPVMHHWAALFQNWMSKFICFTLW